MRLLAALPSTMTIGVLWMTGLSGSVQVPLLFWIVEAPGSSA